MSEIREVLHSLWTALIDRTNQMSLGLGLCVFVLALGVGVMMLAIIKRNHLMIEPVVYSSFGSLRRLKDKHLRDEKEKANSKDKYLLEVKEKLIMTLRQPWKLLSSLDTVL